jgi:hypothetical protein
MIWTDQQINDLAEECLNLVCERVQNRIGQPHGDWAGLYHSDGILLGQIDDYIRYEMEHAKTPHEAGFKAFASTRKFVPNASNVENLHEESTDPALIYDDDYYILICGNKYFLTLERGQYSSTNLEELERKLYAWKLKAS